MRTVHELRQEEVAYELSHKKVEEHFNYNSVLIYENVTDTISCYTEEAQVVFDKELNKQLKN